MATATANSVMAVKAAKTGIILDALKNLAPTLTTVKIVIVSKACANASFFDETDLATSTDPSLATDYVLNFRRSTVGSAAAKLFLKPL